MNAYSKHGDDEAARQPRRVRGRSQSSGWRGMKRRKEVFTTIHPLYVTSRGGYASRRVC